MSFKKGRFSKKELSLLYTLLENGGVETPLRIIAKQMNRSVASIRKQLKDNTIHKHSPYIVPANGKPFSYSATLLFWGSLLILLAINAFFLWSQYSAR